MATEIVAITQVLVSEDGETITIADNYEYGTPNPDRDDVGVYFTAFKVDEDLAETALTVTAFDPETVDEFTIEYDSDGRNKFIFVQAPNWLIGTTYNRYDVVWSLTQNAFYEYVNASATAGNVVTNSTYWSVVPDPTELLENLGQADEPDLLTYQIFEAVLDFNTAKCYADVAILAAKENCNDDCDCKSRIGRAKNKIRTLLSVMRIANIRGRYTAGEKAAREAERYCEDCGCLER